ncbi:hypothetical protein HK103_006439 [Boothiomyces macroporosus]|uniref:Uncharacterized protein n=1 Tax=Boothiomyces macroporosus TaxID=261099 RepID=A0AAD5UL41_9FUNG|nr:hypothetical protein HK103_006439 [Boothiomyces macroporosus]
MLLTLTEIYSDFLLVISIYYLYQLHRNKIVPNIFKAKFTVSLIINISMALVNIIYYFTSNVYLSITSGFLCNTTMYILCLIDVEIIRVFSVLSEYVTPKLIRIWTAILTLVYVTASIEMIIVLFYDGWPQWIAEWINIGSFILAMITMLYDNTQAFYLIYLVFIKKKIHNAIYTETVSFYVKRAALINVALIIFEWCTGLLYIYITFVLSEDFVSRIAGLTVIEVNIGLHSVFLIYVVRNLKELAFIGMRPGNPKVNVPDVPNTELLDTLKS